MPRLTHKLLAALVTFGVGVAAVALWLSLRPRLHLHGFTSRTAPAGAAARQGPGACGEWAAAAPAGQGLGWDLTYMPLLRSSGNCPGHELCEEWPKRPQPPVAKQFAEWQGEPIVSSILLEVPDGHADMMALWLIRTKGHAYWWGFHPHLPNPLGMQPVRAQDYDLAFDEMACWREDVPSNRKFFDPHGDDGYVGFLSLYREGRSRQMFLTGRDFFQSSPAEDAFRNEETWGRLLKTMKPLYLAIREQQRQAKQVRGGK